MKFRAVLYFDGPLSTWLTVPDSREVLASKYFRWKFLAEVWAVSRAKGLDKVRYQIQIHIPKEEGDRECSCPSCQKRAQS